jgi:hypothetical protein
MTREELITLLCAEARRINELTPEAIWYLFGSTLEPFEHAADTDLLVVCDTNEAISLVRDELRDACMCLPLHLFLLTRQEEDELGFIASEGCFQVYPAASVSLR